MTARARALLARAGVLVIAHRGASAHAPENTLAAFERALDAGADLVELDVRASRDGVPMAFHDATLERTTDARARWAGGPWPLAVRSAGELAQLDAGAWFGEAFRGARIPTLAQALALVQPRAVTLVERKTGDAPGLLRVLRDHAGLGDVAVQSFDWTFLEHLHRLEPELVLVALGSKGLRVQDLDRIQAVGAAVVAWRHGDLDADAVAAAHARSLQIWAYTVNEAARARELAAWGLDGLITDRPSEIRNELAAQDGARR